MKRHWLIFALFLTALASWGTAAATSPLDLVALPAILVGGSALLVVWRALAGDRFALLTMIFVSVFLLDSIFRVRDYADKSVDFQILLKASTWMLIAAVAFVRFDVTVAKLLSRERLIWMMLFGWFAVTALWAVNPVFTLVCVFSLCALFVFFDDMIERLGSETVFYTIWISLGAVAFVSILVYFAIPSFGHMKEWVGNVQVLSNRLSGVSGTANAAGRLAALGLLITWLFWPYIKKRGLLVATIVILLNLAVLVLSNSRTALFTTLFIIGFLTFATTKRFHIGMLVASVMMVVGMLLVPYIDDIMVLLSRSGSAQEITSGTSRTHIWYIVTKLIAQKPLHGWGYANSQFILPNYVSEIGHTPTHSHNIFLQLMFMSGLIGLSIFLTGFISRLYMALKNAQKVPIALMMFVLLNGMTESSAFTGVANITSLALILAVVYPSKKAAVAT